MANFDSYDYIIVGAGCSGLSMAIQLLQAGLLEGKQCLLIDSRSQYSLDKSWCGWNVFSHPFEKCVSKTWHQWTVQYDESKITQTSEHLHYKFISSKDYYDYCLNLLQKCSSIDWQLSTEVQEIQSGFIRTDDKIIHAGLIFDARQVRMEFKPQGNFLLQCFYGWHIKTPKPCFNPDEVTLMDFPFDQSTGIHFNYLLPFSETEALIEPTYFLHHTNIPSEQDFFDLATAHLRNRYQCLEFEVLAKEHGILPMMRLTSKPIPKVIKIGSYAGLLRPSTGYAFYGIQRYNAAIVSALVNKTKLPKQPYKKISLWMDEVFLKVCRTNPSAAARIFVSMFQHARPDDVANFMHDTASIRNYFNVVRSVPTKPFINAALSLLMGK